MTEEPNTPWDHFDELTTMVKDFFTVVGVVATLAFVLGYFWALPL